MTLRAEVCGRFTIVGAADTLDRDESGVVLLLADRSYVVKVPAETEDLPLAGALRRLPGASDAVLRFSGFIGDTRLDQAVVLILDALGDIASADEIASEGRADRGLRTQTEAPRRSCPAGAVSEAHRGAGR
jgi:hypothetical protein